MNAKQKIDRGQKTRVNKLSLIAVKAQHAQTPNSQISNLNNSKIKMDAKTIDSIEANNPSQETTELIQRWRDVVKPGIYRMTGGKWKKYHEPKFLRTERKVTEERLQQLIIKNKISANGLDHNKWGASNHRHDGQNNGPSTPFGI